MKNEDMGKFSTSASVEKDSVYLHPDGETHILMAPSGEVLMAIHGNEFRVKLTTRAGRHAARMWAYTIVGEGPENDGLAKAVLDYVGREELIDGLG